MEKTSSIRPGRLHFLAALLLLVLSSSLLDGCLPPPHRSRPPGPPHPNVSIPIHPAPPMA